MNTIPLIFNERPVNCTILGGTEIRANVKIPVSVLLLNQGQSHMRIQNIENLINCGFDQIISMESDIENYNLEDFVQQFPSVKFIIPLERVTEGELINMAMKEFTSDYVLVIKNTVSITSRMLSPTHAMKLMGRDIFCNVPRLMMQDNMQGLPVNFTPVVKHSALRVESSVSVSDGMDTLYAFDNIGLYNRKKFIMLGGFDYTITTRYWQNLDLFMRAWLWGEKTRVSTAFQIAYADDVPVEDCPPDLCQLRFYLKNMVVRFKEDHGEIPAASFLPFFSRSSCGFLESLRQFKDARAWVRKNQYRFRYDAPELVKSWGNLK